LSGSIRRAGNPGEVDCRYDGIKGLVLRTEFIRKRQAMATEELFLLGYAVAKLNDIASIIRISEL